MNIQLIDDNRPIQIVTTDDDWWRVGRDGVTGIEPYGENGQCAEVPWLAVFEGDVLIYRINCAMVETVGYK